MSDAKVIDFNAYRKRKAGNDPNHGRCRICGELVATCRLTDCRRANQ